MPPNFLTALQKYLVLPASSHSPELLWHRIVGWFALSDALFKEAKISTIHLRFDKSIRSQPFAHTPHWLLPRLVVYAQSLLSKPFINQAHYQN